MKTLKEVRTFLDDLYAINCGGCGIAALAMYRWLKQNGELQENDKFVLLYTTYCQGSFLNNEKILKGKNGQPCACSHVCLYHKGEYIDTHRNINPTDYTWVQYVTEEEFVIRALNNVRSWNDLFPRNQMEQIERELGINLKDIRRI